MLIRADTKVRPSNNPTTEAEQGHAATCPYNSNFSISILKKRDPRLRGDDIFFLM